jgi:hypothetical protein
MKEPLKLNKVVQENDYAEGQNSHTVNTGRSKSTVNHVEGKEVNRGLNSSPS